MGNPMKIEIQLIEQINVELLPKRVYDLIIVGVRAAKNHAAKI
jgi:hypothetical protein